jgi:hypothetical protein
MAVQKIVFLYFIMGFLKSHFKNPIWKKSKKNFGLPNLINSGQIRMLVGVPSIRGLNLVGNRFSKISLLGPVTSIIKKCVLMLIPGLFGALGLLKGILMVYPCNLLRQ